VQIRGIRRSLTDLREIEDDTLQYPKIERILAALETAAVCIDHFGEMIIHASTEREERQKTYIQRAQTAQLACLDEMLQAGSPPVLREIGAILTDLNRILIEVSSERMT
ncbi:hypothetical protein SAMN04487897_1781, partial [Paenibacillus sp. yr247]|uniref:hypothetical protein n=1 Tax=Paenibacillus sp. yr247 TaxID=1761880 RepID=UPI00088B4AA2